jgi:hypothetical protein
MPKLGSFGTGSLRPSGFQGIPTQSPTGQFFQTTPGSYTWKVPANVTKVNILLLGGGGGGGGQGRNASGGGGGSLTYANNVTVSPNSVISYQVGAGGSVNGDGGISWFKNSTYLYANGGSKGTAVATNAAGEASYFVTTTNYVSYTTSYPNRTTGSTTGALGSYSMFNWTCPEGVWSVSVVLVAGGGGSSPYLTDTVGGATTTSNLGGVGGQGGAFSYRNNISVIPGTVYKLHVGSKGSNNATSPTSWTNTNSGTMGGDSIFFNIIGIYATAVTSGTYITMNDVSNLSVNATIVFTGATSYGGIETPDIKYIITSVNTTNKTIQVKKSYGSGVTSITTFTNATGFNLSAVSTTIMASGGVPGHGSATTPVANSTLSGGSGTNNIRFGTGGGDGGVGGVPSSSSRIGGGGGGAGGYGSFGGLGGSPNGNTAAAGGAAATSSGGGGGGSSGAYRSTADNYTSTSASSATTIYFSPALLYTYSGAAISKSGTGAGAFAPGTTVSGNAGFSYATLSATPTTAFAGTNVTFTITVTGYSGAGGGGGVQLQGKYGDGSATLAPSSGSANPSVYAGKVGSPWVAVTQRVNLYNTDSSGPASQYYGGGGGGGSARSSDGELAHSGGAGGDGAVRIIWAGSKDVSSTSNATVSTVTFSTSGYQGGGGGGAAGYAGDGGMGGPSYPLIDTVGGAGGWAFTGTPVGDETFSFYGGGGGGSFTGASTQGYWPAGAATGGSGAGGGGSAQTSSSGTQAYGGGGVSYLGQSSVNSAGNATTAGPAKTAGQSAGAATNGGSGGMDGTSSAGGSYGGGGGGGYNGGTGQGGFFRVIWGEGRRYPSTFTQDLVQAGGFTSGLTYKIAVIGSTSQNQWNILAGTTGSPITYDVGQTFTAANITGSYGSGSAYLA